MTFALTLLLLQAASVSGPVLSRSVSCPTLAGSAIGLTQVPAGQSDRLRLDLVLNVIRLCPADFVADASLLPELDRPFKKLPGIQQSDPLSALLAGAAAYELIKQPLLDPKVVKPLLGLLGKPKSVSFTTLKAIEKRDSHDLAEMAARQTDRTGDPQTILLDGTFIMWVVNRSALNAAFEQEAAAQVWLRPYPPTIVEIGPGIGSAGSAANDALATAIRRTALRFNGPVDIWFRRFKIER